eukprot:c29355_g1_i3 orf=190-414(-)
MLNMLVHVWFSTRFFFHVSFKAYDDPPKDVFMWCSIIGNAYIAPIHFHAQHLVLICISKSKWLHGMGEAYGPSC